MANGSFFKELRERKVLKAAAIYGAVAWGVTEIVVTVVEQLFLPQWVATLAVIGFVVGFPIAMFLSWTFDITSDGFHRTEVSSRRGQASIALSMVLLVAGTAGLFLLIKPSLQETGQRSDSPEILPNSIAVLPFANASEFDNDLYISAGLGDELRDQLGRVEGLRVAARASSVIFADGTVDAAGISERLGVAKLIEGTLRRQGDNLRITIAITDGVSGFQDWTKSYDKEATDLLLMQQEIAADVVTQMLPDADPTEAVAAQATFSASANDLMLLARHSFQKVKDEPVVNLELLERAIDLYRQTTEADPASALAHSRLGEALLYLGDVEAAEEPIFRALALDADLSEVQNTLGLYYWVRFLPGSGDAHLRAVELNPNNADALSAYAKWLWHQQITNKTEEYFLRALELDPMSLTRYTDLGNFYGITGQRDKALGIARRIESRFVDAVAYLVIARIYELTGDLDEGIAWAFRSRALDADYPDSIWMLSELYARIGDFQGSAYFGSEHAFNVLYWERRYEEMIEHGEELVFEQPNQEQVWYGLARAYAATGRYEQAAYVLRSRNLPENAFVDSRRGNGMEALMTLADVLNSLGQVELAGEYAAWLAAMFQRQIDTGASTAWWPHLYQACARSILGEDEQALELIRRSAQSPGLLWYPVLADSICFQKYKEEPVYVDAMRTVERRQAELRERLPATLQRYQVDAVNQ